MFELRDWQRKAIEDFYAANKSDFLAAATPGAGKTPYALSLARRLIDEGSVQRVVVVVSTDALRQQWADGAAAFRLNLMPVSGPEDYDKAGYDGCVVTYAQIMKGTGSELLRRSTRVPTLAILDEIHHAGENRSWGDGLRYAVDRATYKLALTGTPWRRDSNSPIPFVVYDEYGKVVVDYSYEYGAAVADGVCRRIEFHAYDGEAKWTDCGKVDSAELGEDLSEDKVSAVLDTVYHPSHQWMPVLLARADEALTDVRLEVPDAGGLVVADRQWHALEYAKIIQSITGQPPTVVISDDPEAKHAIDRFRQSGERWLVAVRMVSEGVDIPRLAVGVYASKTRTPLFFRQVVGRLVRTRVGEEFNARLFIPAVPALMDYAREIEQELRHQLDLEERREREGGNGQGALDLREPLSATAAAFDRAILAGEETSPGEYAAAQAKCRELGIPGQYALNLLPLLRPGTLPAPAVPVTETPRHRREKLLRSSVETLARKFAYRAGVPPKQVNIDLRKEGFPARKQASIEDLEKIEARLAHWLGEL
jgi:superfamily II DNA or RNA helicase